MLKNSTCWEIKELFVFAYSSKIWNQDLRKGTNFIVSKTLKLYDQKILPKDLSDCPYGNQTLNLNLLCDMPLKTKPEDQVI